MNMQLNFINQSNDTNNSQIVIFQSIDQLTEVDCPAGHQQRVDFLSDGTNTPIRIAVVAKPKVRPRTEATLAGITVLGLQNIRSADIVMTGGGTGAKAQPYKFMVANALRASITAQPDATVNPAKPKK
jgi:hypothetical protein